MAGVNSFRDWLWALKSEPCTDCGLAWPPYVMQFDHLPGFQKEFGVTVRAWGKGRAKVLEEIAKCELVCANCHFIRTHQRLQG